MAPGTACHVKAVVRGKLLKTAPLGGLSNLGAGNWGLLVPEPPDDEPDEPPDDEPDEPPEEIPDPEDGPAGAWIGCQTPVVYSAVRRRATAETNPAIPVSSPGRVFQNDLIMRGTGPSRFRIFQWISYDPIRLIQPVLRVQ